MTCSADQKSLPGPHHCSALGKSLVKIVFSTLKAEAENNQGTLSTEDVSRIEKAFDQMDSVMFPHFIDTYNFCLDSTPANNSTPFHQEDPLFFYLRVRTSKIVSTLFARQIQYRASRWRAAFCRQLGHFLDEVTDWGINEELTKVYFELGRRMGRELTATDIGNDMRGNQILTAALREIATQHRKDPKFALKLRNSINEGIGAQYPGATEIDTLITQKQANRLLDALELLGRKNWSPNSDTGTETAAEKRH